MISQIWSFIIAAIMVLISLFAGIFIDYRVNLRGYSGGANTDFHYSKYRDDSGFIEEGPFIDDNKQEYLNRDYSQIMFSRIPLFSPSSVLGRGFRDVHLANKIIRSKIMTGRGKYWTNQTLSYTRNRKSFKKLYAAITQAIPSGDLNIIDATSNIGGDCMSFAMEPRVKSVAAYEILPNVCDILRNNIKLYGFEDKIKVHCGKFDYEVPHTPGSSTVIIIDPPYEKGNNAGHFNLSIDDMPIFAVVDRVLAKGADLVVVSMPRDYIYNCTAARDFSQEVTVVPTEKNVKFFLIKRKISVEGGF